jgi:hypothetical protein
MNVTSGSHSTRRMGESPPGRLLLPGRPGGWRDDVVLVSIKRLPRMSPAGWQYPILPDTMHGYGDPDHDRVATAWTSVRKDLPVVRLGPFLKANPRFLLLRTGFDSGRSALAD